MRDRLCQGWLVQYWSLVRNQAVRSRVKNNVGWAGSSVGSVLV